MITIWIIKEGDKIIAYSTKKLSDDETPLDITLDEYKHLEETGNL